MEKRLAVFLKNKISFFIAVFFKSAPERKIFIIVGEISQKV